MSLKLNRLILYASSIVGSYLCIPLFLIFSYGSDITDLVPEFVILLMSLILTISICLVHLAIEWEQGIGFILVGWFFVLLFSIFFIQIPLLTPNSIALSDLPYTNLRTVDDSGLVLNDKIVRSSSPEVARVRQRSAAHPEDRSDPYIERYFLSWRYGVLLGKSQDIWGALYPTGFTENIIYSFRTVSETVFRFFLFTFFPFAFMFYYNKYKSDNTNLTEEKIDRFESNIYLQSIIYSITIGLVLLGGLSIVLSLP